MKPSAPLSPAARALLELGTQVAPPSAEQNERMARALAPLFAGRAAAGANLSSASGVRASSEPRAGALALGGDGARVPPPARHAARPGGAAGIGGAPLVLALGALAATAGAAFWLGRASTAASPDLPAERVPVAAAARVQARAAEPSRSPLGAPSILPLPVQAPRASGLALPAPLVARARPELAQLPAGAQAPGAPEPLPAVAGVSERHVPERAAPARHAGSGLLRDLERLGRAEAALRQGQPALALSGLGAKPVPQLAEQAAALRAIASCDLGIPEGPALAAEALERWPRSAFAARVRLACGL